MRDIERLNTYNTESCIIGLGPAGLTFIIIKDALLEKVVADRKIPTMLQYGIHIDKGSMYNTMRLCVFADLVW